MDTVPIYLDYNATTPVDERVLEAMMPFLKGSFGNPSSNHVLGQVANEAVKDARLQLSNLVGCSPGEIVFTSGGTESNNHAIRGVAQTFGNKRRHIISSVIEHPAVLETLRHLEGQGFEVTYLPVDQYGMVSVEDVKAALRSDTILITIMHSNNEVGTLQPISEIVRLAHERGVIVHTDAAQSVGKVPINVQNLGVDLLSIAGHKMYALKGIGALYIREGLAIQNLMFGAPQESGKRPGTESVASIVALGKAAEIADQDVSNEAKRLTELRDTLHSSIQHRIGKARLNGHPVKRLPNTLNLSFYGIDVGELLANVPEIAVSTRSACHSGSNTPSQVLIAMGLDEKLAQNTMRISVGRYTKRSDIEAFVDLLQSRVK